MKQTTLQFLFAVTIVVLVIAFPTNIRAANYTVTNVTDSGGGSLRDAITTANSTTENDTIEFNITESCFVCSIILNNDIPINGSGSGALTITNSTGAERLLISGNNRTRIFYVRDGANFTLNGVTITNGNAAGTLNTQYNGYGGGIMLAFLNSGGVFTLTNSIIRNNTAQYGGGLYRSGTSSNLGSATITNSTISNNSAQEGGGISNSFRMTVTSSTISNNTAGVGGGIYNYFGTLTMTNSTISGNSAGSNGGGINNRDGSMTLRDLTISKNTTSAKGGGIYNFSSLGFSSIRNSIVAANTAINGQPDIYNASNFSSNGINLIGNSSTNGTINWLPSDILNQPPRLAQLSNYGGGTQTHALLSGSPAINAGSRSSTLDQRGLVQNGAADIGAFELQAYENFTFNKSTDFDGDGKSDISVFRPDNGAWYIQQSTNGFTGLQFGLATDKLVPADYDGDGKTDVAVYRSGIWYLQRSQAGFTGVQFGDGNDIPQPADFDGDGKAEIAVFRPSNGTWYVLNLVNNQFTALAFGQNGDKPVVGDYDGDGKADYAVYRNGNWYLQRSQLGFTGVPFGDANDKPVPADYDGDGKADVAVFRPSNGVWYLLQSTAGFTGVAFGLGTDLPTPADYDGDGKTDVAVFRGGNWYLNRSTAGFTGVQFGAATDKPIPNAIVP